MAIARPCTVSFESFELRLARCQRARALRTCQEDKHNSHVESLRCVNWDGSSNKQGSFSHSLGKYSLSAALPRGSMTVDSVSIQPSKRQLPITEVENCGTWICSCLSIIQNVYLHSRAWASRQQRHDEPHAPYRCSLFTCSTSTSSFRCVVSVCMGPQM